MSKYAAVSMAEDWLFKNGFPFWMENGIDWEKGGFVESLSLDGENHHAPLKRTRVTARQIYVFCQAHELGVAGALDAVEHGINFLTGPTWLGDEIGFARTLSRDAEPLDATPDLYDYAFVLFAFSWAYKATGNGQLLDWAHRTLDATETFLRDQRGIGFWHDADRKGWRQQNPHMHLLEAALAATEYFQDVRFSQLAIEMTDLFAHTFFDHEQGVLPEFFADDWSMAPGIAGQIVEPGHQFEWSWILHHANRLLGIETFPIVRTLIHSAEEYGVNPSTGLVYNQIDGAGRTLDAGQRSWPNTERLKAACALYEIDGIDPMPIFNQSLNGLMQFHLGHAPRGTWIDMFNAKGEPISTFIPASTLYHVVLGFSETIRIASKIRSAEKQSENIQGS